MFVLFHFYLKIIEFMKYMYLLVEKIVEYEEQLKIRVYTDIDKAIYHLIEKVKQYNNDNETINSVIQERKFFKWLSDTTLRHRVYIWIQESNDNDFSIKFDNNFYKTFMVQ